MSEEYWEHDPEILINSLKNGSIRSLIFGKELVLGTTERVYSNYYGEYFVRLIGVEIPHLFKSDKRYTRFCDKSLEIFPMWRKTSVVVMTDCFDDFECFMIQVAIREDNKGWSYKDTEYESSCVDKKPSKHLPIAITEKKLLRFLEKWPEFVLGIDKYNEALKFYSEEDF